MLNMIDRQLQRESLRGLVGSLIFCPECERVLDAPQSVAVIGPGRNHWCGCAACWGKGATTTGQHSAGWMILDGRLLWARQPRKRAKRAKGAA